MKVVQNGVLPAGILIAGFERRGRVLFCRGNLLAVTFWDEGSHCLLEGAVRDTQKGLMADCFYGEMSKCH
ncbi:MAG: hypothetical protein MPJ24_05600 [Pirellulaceae bacterium]|nr:hypothetical protein [Pirellulaceae bacterium]